jgi:hypothetical protein
MPGRISLERAEVEQLSDRLVVTCTDGRTLYFCEADGGATLDEWRAVISVASKQFPSSGTARPQHPQVADAGQVAAAIARRAATTVADAAAAGTATSAAQTMAQEHPACDEEHQGELTLHAEIAELEAQNAAMEARLRVTKRPSFQAAGAPSLDAQLKAGTADSDDESPRARRPSMLERIAEALTPPRPSKQGSTVQDEEDAELEAEIAELEAQNAAMEVKLQLNKRKSFQAAKFR